MATSAQGARSDGAQRAPRRVLGVDPGTACTGWAIVERAGANLRGVTAGTLRTRSERPLAERLHRIYQGLAAVIDEQRPGAVAVEDIFYAKHANAALKLGHVRGVALVVAAETGLEVFAYPPALVKRTLAGRGRADKRQIAHLVGAVLGWRNLPEADATDALAIAITHLQAQQAGAARAHPSGARRRR